MKVVHHVTGAPPPDPARDAVHREIEAVRRRVPGPLVHLEGGSAWRKRLPFAWRAVATARRVRELDRSCDLHHVWADRLDWCRAFASARRPVVYSLVTTYDPALMTVPARRPARLSVVAADLRSHALLSAAGLPVDGVVPAGCDLSGFTPAPPPPAPPFVLLAGSAPWTPRQFRTKGVELLLRLVERDPELRLVLLWRGALEERIERRLRDRRLNERVRVERELVDVSRLLQDCHAAVVLARHSRLVKAFPHSLIEALAAGRPALVSSCLGIADWVREAACGVVVEELDLPSLQAAVHRLRRDLAPLTAGAGAADLRNFSLEAMTSSCESLYSRALEAAAPAAARPT